MKGAPAALPGGCWQCCPPTGPLLSAPQLSPGSPPTPSRLASGARTRAGVRVLGAGSRVRAELCTAAAVSDASSEMRLKKENPSR